MVLATPRQITREIGAPSIDPEINLGLANRPAASATCHRENCVCSIDSSNAERSRSKAGTLRPLRSDTGISNLGRGLYAQRRSCCRNTNCALKHLRDASSPDCLFGLLGSTISRKSNGPDFDRKRGTTSFPELYRGLRLGKFTIAETCQPKTNSWRNRCNLLARSVSVSTKLLAPDKRKVTFRRTSIALILAAINTRFHRNAFGPLLESGGLRFHTPALIPLLYHCPHAPHSGAYRV